MVDRVLAGRPGRRGALRAAALVPILVGSIGCASDANPAPRHKPVPQIAAAKPGSNPIAGQRLYVNPHNPAALQAARWRRSGRKAEAAAMSVLARQPTALWLADPGGISARVRGETKRAARAGRTALLVAYHVPGRDCGNYSAGGSGSPEAYRAWVRAFARGIGSRNAIVILEPDAIPQAIIQNCLSPEAKGERYALLADAVATFQRRPHVAVYVDAGNPGWVRPPTGMVGPLRASGIAKADGFALNVSNFFSNKKVISYGRGLSRHLHGAHFVIDTSRNGNGATLKDDPGGPKWCNPPGRAIGHSPTTSTGKSKVDAYLWVKTPGASDGTCRAGAPPAGHWWPEYALQLVRNR
jgi:endoglucanase